jgi:hypothetical protein
VEAAIRAVVVRAVPASHALRTWLDSWAGIGHVAVGMARQSYGLKLTRYDETAGEPLLHDGDGALTRLLARVGERTPWRAAWEAFKKAEASLLSRPVCARTPTPGSTGGGSGKSLAA